MTPRSAFPALLASTIAVAAVAVWAPIATGQPEHEDPDSSGCETGYLPRNARPGDDICVAKDFARRTAQQNQNPKANKEPDGGAYGPETCKQGFVWREAFEGDTICVTPDIRAQNLAANADPGAHRSAPQPTPTPSPQPMPDATAGHSVVFEITGSGTVYSIDFDPAGARVGENTAVPFERTLDIAPDVVVLTVNAVTKTGSQGCRILLDGKVVAEQPAPNSFCTFSIP